MCGWRGRRFRGRFPTNSSRCWFHPVYPAPAARSRYEPYQVDIALWRDTQGQWQSVLQDCDGPVPAALEAVTKRWRRLSVPRPFADQQAADE
jgi:hypothetical protein